MAGCNSGRSHRLMTGLRISGCAAIVSLSLLFGACPKEEKRELSDNTVPVRVRQLAPEHYVMRRTLVGEVQPWRKITLSCQVGGPITAFHCEKGDEVATGQLLAQIDDRDPRFGLRDAEASVTELEQLLAKTRSLTRPQQMATLQARCSQCEANLRKAQLEYDRAKQLLADNVLARSQFDQVEAAYEAAVAQRTVSQEELKLAEEGARLEDIRTVEVQLDRARVAVEQARKRLADARVESPATALVVGRYREVGETVRPGEPLLDLVEMDRVKILLHVAEQDLVRLAREQEVSVVVDAVANRRFAGRIHYISEVANSLLRTFDVEVAVANDDRALKPGMVARVAVVTGSVEQALVIPETLVVEREGQPGFFYLDGESAAFFSLAGTLRDGDQWVVRAPDPPVGPVIETRTSRLSPGILVRVVKEQDAAR